MEAFRFVERRRRGSCFVSESRPDSGCPSSEELATYARGMLPAASVEPLTVHIAGCARCEETVVELAAASAVKLVGPLQAAVVEQPFVDESECVEVVELLRRQGPFVDDTSAASGAGSTADALLNLPATTRSQLVELVATLGLATADDIAAAVASLPEAERTADDATSAQALAANLVTAGKLTDYQAAAILRGRGKSLVFGEYILVERCGSGGMGHVFRARHRRMNRVVALKVMSTAALRSADALKRFEREARAAAKLIHPHIVHAYDAGTQDGVPYLVMEYVAGSDLATILKRDGKLDIKRACDYLAQAARGLVFAHEQGIVHRDIKPGNLLVSETGGVVKVLDLGLARFQEPSVGQALPAGELTNSGALMGTVDYMAPEQALNTSRADAKADVYSLGCTLFRVLTGESVFAGETMMEKLVAHREQTPRRLRTRRPDAPQELDELVAAMLAKQPSARPAMIDVAMRLMTLADPPSDVASDGPAQRRAASRQKRMAIGAILSLAAVVAIAIALWRGREARDTVVKPDGGTVGVSPTNLGGANLAANSLGVPAARPKPNLYIYPELYVPGRKTITVDSVHFEEEGPMTIEAWVVAEPNPSMQAFFDSGRRTPINSSDLPAFFEFGGGTMFANARAAWEIHPMMPDVRQVGFGCRAPAPKDLVGFSGHLIGSEPGNTTEWHHIAVCFSALANNQRIIRRWWDGVAVAPPVFSMSIVDDPTEYLRSSGFIDELRVSRSVRYTTEFKPDRRMTSDADTIALYHCDEGEGDVLIDASGHEHHGKLVGAQWASVDKFRVALPRSAPVIPWTTPPRSSIVTMPPLPAPKPVPKSSTPSTNAATPNVAGSPRDNLFVYADKFDINDPIITFDSIHDDFPGGYTIEAWTVADENLSASLREHFNRTARSTAQPAFFEFNSGPGTPPTARATWKVLGQGPLAERHYFVANKLKPPPQDTSGRSVTFGTMPIMNSWQMHPELNHIAISFGPIVDGKQTFNYWWNGAGTPNTFSIPFIHDPADVLRSHGYIDELRISKGERYKKDFVPARRFESDADTIALYRCDEGTGDVLIDSSGHERHAKVKNAKWASVASYATATPRFREPSSKGSPTAGPSPSSPAPTK